MAWAMTSFNPIALLPWAIPAAILLGIVFRFRKWNSGSRPGLIAQWVSFISIADKLNGKVRNWPEADQSTILKDVRV